MKKQFAILLAIGLIILASCSPTGYGTTTSDVTTPEVKLLAMQPLKDARTRTQLHSMDAA